MEIFHNPNIDFLGKKWYFIALSAVLIGAGLLSMLFWHGIPLGIDFRGGTLVTVKFAHPPDYDKVRSQLDAAGLPAAQIQRYGPEELNEVLIAIDLSHTSEESLDQGRNQIVNALQGGQPDKPDLNNAGVQAIADSLVQSDPLKAGAEARDRYTQLAEQVVSHRDRTLGGVLGSFDQLKTAVPDGVVQSLQAGFSLSDFSVRNVDVVGPQVGKQLQSQARLAILYSLLGMLVYIAVRFEFIYGLAATTAVAHDALVTVGIFSLLNEEISLTVIASLLTLVGYSMNDTIVIFDRVRENVRLLRRESYAEIVNRSINQTLNRTILTAGVTFLTVLSLFLFGGEVLRGFSLVLVIGVIVGTYSTLFIATPIVVGYHDRRRGLKLAAAPAQASSGGSARREKAQVKG
ncbi:MAG: protein translocase subunit SecF [Candidatus Korobacteraceae bacterium]